MHSRWSRRIALGIVSALTATFAFIGFVQGTAGATACMITSPLLLRTATTSASAAFTTQLATTVTLAPSPTPRPRRRTPPTSSSPPGLVTTGGTLPAGDLSGQRHRR